MLKQKSTELFPCEIIYGAILQPKTKNYTYNILMPSSTVAAYYSNTKPREIEIRIKQQQSWSGPIALAPTESQRLRMAGALSGFIDNYNVEISLCEMKIYFQQNL
jgi:hypothetical protein